MEELVLQISYYLPVEWFDLENEEYIEYLIDAYLKNIESETYQFAFIAFHMLYMSFIYKTIWLLKKESYESIEHFISQVSKDFQVVFSPFDFSIIEEAKSFQILKCLRFHPNDIELFSLPVKNRNHCSHASGKVQYSKEEVERFISDELHSSETILQKTKLCLESLFKKFINDNWDPETRELISPKESAETFIRQNLLSPKELEILTSVVIPELNEESKNKKNIYVKILYLIFLAVAQNYIDHGENLLLNKLPLLMHGFSKQSEFSLEKLINDEFSEILNDFNEKDKNIFAQTTHYDLPDFLLRADMG